MERIIRKSISIVSLLILPVVAFGVAYGLARVEEYAFILFVYPLLIGLAVGFFSGSWMYVARVANRIFVVGFTVVLTVVGCAGLQLGRYDAARAVFDELFLAAAGETLVLDKDLRHFGDDSLESDTIRPDVERLDLEWREFLLREVEEEGLVGFLLVREKMGIRTHALSALAASPFWVRSVWILEILFMGGVLFQLIWGVAKTPLCIRCETWLTLSEVGFCHGQEEMESVADAIAQNGVASVRSRLHGKGKGKGKTPLVRVFCVVEETCLCPGSVAAWLILDDAGIPIRRIVEMGGAEPFSPKEAETA